MYFVIKQSYNMEVWVYIFITAYIKIKNKNKQEFSNDDRIWSQFCPYIKIIFHFMINIGDLYIYTHTYVYNVKRDYIWVIEL